MAEHSYEHGIDFIRYWKIPDPCLGPKTYVGVPVHMVCTRFHLLGYDDGRLVRLKGHGNS